MENTIAVNIRRLREKIKQSLTTILSGLSLQMDILTEVAAAQRDPRGSQSGEGVKGNGIRLLPSAEKTLVSAPRIPLLAYSEQSE